MSAVIRTTQVLVHAPLQIVFDYVSDLTKHPEWSGGQLKVKALSSDPIGVGKEYISHGEVGLEKERPNKVKVTEYNSPRTFGFVANDPGFGEVFHIFTFTEQGEGVLVTRTMTVTMNPVSALVFRFIIYPIIGNPIMNKSLAALKTKLE